MLSEMPTITEEKKTTQEGEQAPFGGAAENEVSRKEIGRER